MEFSALPLRALVLILPFSIFTFLFSVDVDAQDVNTNTTLFSCTSDNTSCGTFVLYRTRAEYADVELISDLFGVSRLMIKEVNDLPSENGTLLPDQLILIPLECGCTGSRSFGNITYWIKEGDNFYLVSTEAFENLTEYHVIQDFNPTLDAADLKTGQGVIVPIYCKCPEKTQVDQGIKYLITYVWSSADHVEMMSMEMGSSAEAIMVANNYRNFSAAASQPILIPVSAKPHLPAPLYDATAPSAGKDHQRAKPNKRAIVVSSVVGVVSGVVIWTCLLLACCMISRKKLIARTASNLEAADHLPATPNKLPSKNQRLCTLTRGNKLLAGVSQFIDRPVMFNVQGIMEATMNLNEGCKIEGAVYRATLNEEVYAVKQARGDAAAEMRIFQTVNHANLVRLAGFAIHEDGHCLWVYEFVENGSLDKWLFSKTASSSSSSSSSESSSISCLSWRQRLNIALDVANGLHYLHEHTRPSIVHGAIKSSNVLLDARFKAKISNFSSAKPATIGVRPSGDVFDFGVLMQELLSGRRETSGEGTEDVLEDEEAKKVERLRRWMDPKLKGRYPMEGAVSLAAMAKACTVEDSTERPSISEIVLGLSVLSQSSSGESFARPWTPRAEQSVPVKDVVVAR